jgi:hypothetical protein
MSITECSAPAEGPVFAMTNTTVLMTDMAILAVIFLLGTLAKIFPKSDRNTGSKQ